MSFVAEVIAIENLCKVEDEEEEEEDLPADLKPRKESGAVWPEEYHESTKVVVKSGYLWKKSSFGVSMGVNGRISARAKYFVLTTKSLDYYRNAKCEKLRGSFPLAVISAVEMDICNNAVFRLCLPQQDPVSLMARNAQECKEWIQHIRNGISKWSTGDSARAFHYEGTEGTEEELVDIFPSEVIPKKVDMKGLTMCKALHREFAMIKYARAGTAIPHERVFKIDSNHLLQEFVFGADEKLPLCKLIELADPLLVYPLLCPLKYKLAKGGRKMQIMWRVGRRENGYQYKCTLGLDKIVEVRCGQQTRNFNQFPYLEVERQSFSLMFEKEQGEWSQLSSLDLICDSMPVFQEWKTGLQELVYGADEKLPLCKLIELADPLLVHLKRHWATMEYKDQISFDQATGFLHKLLPEVNKREARNSMRNINKIQRGLGRETEHLPWDSFLVLFNSFNNHPKLYDLYKTYTQTFPDFGMTAQEFMEFLVKEQGESKVNIQSCMKLIEYHDEPYLIYKRMHAGEDPEAFQISRQLLSYHGFVSFLRSKDNAAFDFTHEILHQDMDQSLSHYFINSSHNTYLTSHQLKGLSSCEAYVRALQMNCRCLELDCWDGAEEPVITHGMTLTTKIRFRDVLEVIKEYAFETNPYPVILSLENHCSAEQQFIMANMFVSVFGDLLATEDLCENNVLPSPNQLLRKIILKGRPRAKKKSRPKFGSVKQHSPRASARLRTLSSSSLRPEPSKIPLSKTVSAGTSVTDDSISQAGELPDELVQIPLEQSMSRLIVYCRAVAFKRGELSENCCEMHSFNEGHALEIIERMPMDMLFMSTKKLLRAYPKGSRVDSSNYNPMQMWKAGIHMAAINFQKPDAAMHINAGFFRRNGNCGYVLKPECLRKAGTLYHPAIVESPKDVTPKLIEIEVWSAQVLHSDLTGHQPISVEIESVGVDVDCASFSTEVSSNFFNPRFHRTPMPFKLIMPEMCVIYFKILSCGRTTRLILQNVIPVPSLKTGVRYVPMRTLTGAKACESGVFVRITSTPLLLEKEEVTERKASQSLSEKSKSRTSVSSLC